MSTIKSLLVTREPGSFIKLEQWCAKHQIKLKQLPFIKVEAVLDAEIHSTDWIFFSSPKGAQNYIRHYFVVAERIASIGKGTAEILIKAGFQVHFIGESIDSPAAIGQKFNAFIPPHSTVFFPLGDRSKRSVIDQIDAKRIKESTTYKTVDQFHSLNEPFDAILFTSPSNFQSYIQSNSIDAGTHIIAMGNTTEKAILAHNKSYKVNVLEAPTQEAIINLLENLIS